MTRTLVPGVLLLALGCATTGVDSVDEEAGMEMRAVEQAVGGEVGVAEGERDLPPIDLVEHGETQVASFGLG
jgi:hypothetical protein